MKKLMIAALAIVATVAANAAATNWRFKTSDVIGVDNVAGTLYTSGSSIQLFASVSGENEWFNVTAGSGFDLTDGAVSYTATVFESQQFTVGTDYDFYYTITDTNGKGQDATFTSSIVEGKGAQQGSTTSINFGSQDGTTWQSVPEPTSGLLLLLGMAGLALRRRHA